MLSPVLPSPETCKHIARPLLPAAEPEPDSISGGAAFDRRIGPSASALSGAGKEPDGGRRKAAGERRPAAQMRRDEVTPSPSNMRTLIRLGLIGGSQNRQGGGNGQEPQSLPPEATDPVMRTPGSSGPEIQVGMQGIQNAGERELFGPFRSLPAGKRLGGGSAGRVRKCGASIAGSACLHRFVQNCSRQRLPIRAILCENCTRERA